MWRGAFSKASRRPNVLFVAVDDMRDWTAGLRGYRGTVHTPTQDRLARRGVLFTNAHCPSPVCNPSRTAILLGLRPSTTGIYNNGQWWRPAFPEIVTLPMHFKGHGYHVGGAGKIFHHTAGFNPPDQWHEYFQQVFDNPWELKDRLNYPWIPPTPVPAGYPFNGLGGEAHEFDWGPLDKPEAEFGDAKAAQWAIDYLKRSHDRPFFLALGIYRPHLPLYAPRKYFDMYPLDSIRLPEVCEDDLSDVPPEGRALARQRWDQYQLVLRAGKMKEFARAYLASITFADAQVGRVLDALESSPYARNTIVVFWSDHGWHLGEKQHIQKFTLWEESARVPFIVAAHGVTKPGTQCSRPVGLIDIYPTLIELCALSAKPELDGQSLVPLLKDPRREWTRPVLTTYNRGQHAVRSERWRYIRYSDGSEELYDHLKDPNEWTNLAGRAELDRVKREHRRWLPKEDAEPRPTKAAYDFDPAAYSWKPARRRLQ